ncbi:hypothetical protein CDAR_296511 [Caerostris darwini]|uniref:Uncharacterized protein n=1 Tax=Caerostris darwini TaxID=1538125 RepID=A0AAV4PMV8_9ARAC|nr:hypothetical protein CDAR_296511 [Caerostris darwini]
MLLMKSKESDKRQKKKTSFSKSEAPFFSPSLRQMQRAKRAIEEYNSFPDNVFSRPELAIKRPSKSKWTLGGRNKDINRKGLPVLKTV